MFDFKKVLKKIKILDNAKVERGVEYTNVDLNDIDKTEVGVFYSTCTNIPFQDSGGYLTTIVMSSNFTVQKAINASNGDNYQRIKVSGQWKPWIKKESWISDTNSYVLTPNNPTITIPYSFDQIDEFCFRILGTDSASFGFLTIPKDLWHNSGTYAITIRAFSGNGNTVAGYASLVCQNKTDNSFQIKMSNSSCNSVVVSFKLK